MSIDDTSVLTVGLWRSVLHDVIDDVLDRILLTAEWEWEFDDRSDGEEHDPPGDPPGGPGPVPLGVALDAALVAQIRRRTGPCGCDGTLRITRGWAERILERPDGVLDAHRAAGRACDCAVLHHVLGRAGPSPRCPSDPGLRPGGQEPGSGA